MNDRPVHRYAGPTVAEDRSITHACGCGFMSEKLEAIIEHTRDVIERDNLLEEMDRRHPGEGWLGP